MTVVMMLLDYILSDSFYWSESLSNLAAWALTLAVGILAIPIITPLYHWAYGQSLLELDDSSIWTIAAAILIYDFLYYWYHRLSHAFWPLWNVHAVHHQATHLSPSLGLKSSILDFAAICLVTIPMVLIGFGSQSLIIALGIHGLYQLFLHQQWQFSLGPLELVLNTHNHHALHHAKNKEYIDKNFGSIFIIWDKLFGTFVKKNKAPIIGIHGGNYAFDPVLSNLMPWLKLKNKNKFIPNYNKFYFNRLMYLGAVILILSWLLLDLKNQTFLYAIPVVLILNTMVQLIVFNSGSKMKTAEK